MVFIKTLMNVDQIYSSYLLKVKLNSIGPYSKYYNTFYGCKNAFTLSEKISFHQGSTEPPWGPHL